MMQNFTLNQLMRMLYGETSPEESYMLMEIIDGSHDLQQEFAQMQSSISQLSLTPIGPSNSVVEKVLTYSRNNALELSV